jgi:AbrB family looped-hinge helix DNA binding protein
MEIEITKLSSKGQIVIPEKIRRDFKEGTPFLVKEFDNMILLKRIEGISKEDLETLKGIKKAWDDLASGKGKMQNAGEFLEDLKKW